ncbi:DUF3486 family protein [Thioalkalivibrio sp. ALMg9]|uniref:DUF3486 family protein n=1 Tax=Thioalkalivibrio sp. ALMg9 TaxID=1266912 RepID=UPI00036546D6|nr:DUF3486 family protein [Thioalkalivibrio sp. ALMg9]
MPQRSAVSQLPEEVRSALDRRLAEQGFANYDRLVEWLTEQGFQISRSAVHRYGQALEERLADIRASTEAARLITAEVEDAEDNQSSALLRMIQSEMFQVLMNLRQANDAELDADQRVALLARAGKAAAEVARASMTQKKLAADVRRQAQAEAAERAETVARKAGVSAEGVAALRAAILEEMA